MAINRVTKLMLLLVMTLLTITGLAACGSATPAAQVVPANQVAKPPVSVAPTSTVPIVSAPAPAALASTAAAVAPANMEQVESFSGTIALIALEGSADLASSYRPAAVYLVGGKPRKLTKILTGGTYSQVSLAPGSGILAFRDDGLTQGADKSVKQNPDKAGVYLMSLPDGQPKLVRAGAANPQFSPDGASLAYSAPADPAGSGPTDIYLYQVANGKETRLTQAQSATGVYSTPRWSPDGKTLAVNLLAGNGGGQVALLPLVAPYQVKSLAVQPEGAALDAAWTSVPSWAPDGKHLVLAAGGCCPPDPQALMVVDTTAGTTAKLAVVARTPLWSPKGDAMLVEQNEEVHVVAPDGNNNRTIFSHPEAYVTRPVAWNPSGSHLLYVITHQGGDSGRFNGLYVGQTTGKSILLYAGFIVDADWKD